MDAFLIRKSVGGTTGTAATKNAGGNKRSAKQSSSQPAKKKKMTTTKRKKKINLDALYKKLHKEVSKGGKKKFYTCKYQLEYLWDGVEKMMFDMLRETAEAVKDEDPQLVCKAFTTLLRSFVDAMYKSESKVINPGRGMWENLENISDYIVSVVVPLRPALTNDLMEDLATAMQEWYDKGEPYGLMNGYDMATAVKRIRRGEDDDKQTKTVSSPTNTVATVGSTGSASVTQ